MPGVYSTHVNLVSETADVLYNPKAVTTDDIGERINMIGYEYMGIHDNNSINNEILEKKHAESQKNRLYRIIIGFFFSALLMYLMFGNVDLGHNASYIMLAISILPLTFLWIVIVFSTPIFFEARYMFSYHLAFPWLIYLAMHKGETSIDAIATFENKV